MSSARDLGREMSALARSLRRHDRRAARRHRSALLGNDIGVFLPLSEGGELAGIPYAAGIL